jgi:hypothetical protein
MHGKKGKCEECGKMRILGTEAKGDMIRYICDDCCDRLQQEYMRRQSDAFEQYMSELSDDLAKQAIQKVSDHVAREQKNERVVEKKKGKSHEMEIGIHGLEKLKRKSKKPTDSK